MDEDAEMAGWFQIQLEEREQFEQEHEVLRSDPQFEEWLEATRY